MLCLALLILASAVALALPAVSPSIEADAEYLLTTTDFMDAQYGMSIEDVSADAEAVTVTTTGAQFAFSPADATLTLKQRIGKERTVATLQFTKGSLSGLKVTRQGTGAVLLEAEGLRLRVNGDSLLMLQPRDEIALTCTPAFAPGWAKTWSGSRLMLDEYGGYGVYAAAGECADKSGPLDRTSTHTVGPEGVLWVSVAPPKPYDWEASFQDRVVWHWSTTTGYPSDEEIAAWSPYGNILLQQAEVMLWKDWGLRFIPRFGPEEFQRVNATCEKHGMRNIVYTSPYYFLTGTHFEPMAVNNFDNGVTFHPGEGSGKNWPIFLEQIQKVMREDKPDGLYFDGIYANVVREYLISRKSRETVGEDGILEFHATGRAPGGDVFLPQTHAYFNFILSGEGNEAAYADPDYLRFFVSTYNISNSVGVLCNNNAHTLSPEFLNTLLDNNIRLHFIPGWAGDYRLAALQEHYWPALRPDLKDRVAAAGEVRHVRHQEYARTMSEVLKAGVGDLQPAHDEDFDAPAQWQDGEAISGWTARLSPIAKATAQATDGVLRIQGLGNTYGFIEREIPQDATCVECELRGTGEFGMSWGPGIALFVGDRCLRVGVRTDDRAQVDRTGSQILYNDFPSGAWVRLRVRLSLDHAIFEAAPEGGDWRLLDVTRISGATGPRRIAVGKVPFDGKAVDYAEVGGPGGCEVRNVRVLRPE